MEKKDIISGNKKIAQFMGYTYFPWNHPEILKIDKHGNKRDAGWKKTIDTSAFVKFNQIKKLGKDAFLCRDNKGLQYHENWSWLIPAAHKCIDIINNDYSIIEINSAEEMHARRIWTMQLGNTIEKVWEAVIDFIDYYKKRN